MATNPIPTLPPDDRELTQDEWWDFVESLYGSGREMYAKVGGGEAWVRYLRSETDEDSGEELR